MRTDHARSTTRRPRHPDRSISRGRLTLCLLATSFALGATAARAQVKWTEHVLTTAFDSPSSIHAADVDGDGDVDVLSTAWFEGRVNWYENDGGAPPTFTVRNVPPLANGPQSVFARDLDGDGDIDLVVASEIDDEVSWYESDGGAPPTFTERIVSTTADGARAVHAEDLDGDGDTDVLAVSFNDDTIAWYENDGGAPPTFTERTVSTTADGAYRIYAIDLDDDLDVDILTTWANADTVAWYENDGGAPPAFTERVISTTLGFANGVHAADLDGDLDMDVVATSGTDDTLVWYASDGGSPPAFSERPVSTSADGLAAVYAADVDGDGDVDLATASVTDDEIAWWESDGLVPPTFTRRVVSTAAQGAIRVLATDVDGDGFLDLVSASQFDQKVSWHEQLRLGARVTGMTLRRIACRNLTTGQAGGAVVAGGTTEWTCGDLGVEADPSDRVLLNGAGAADGSSGVGGTVEALSPSTLRRISCRNLTTAQTVELVTGADSWDCEAEGLVVTPGDRVEQTITGEV